MTPDEIKATAISRPFAFRMLAAQFQDEIRTAMMDRPEAEKAPKLPETGPNAGTLARTMAPGTNTLRICMVTEAGREYTASDIRRLIDLPSNRSAPHKLMKAPVQRGFFVVTTIDKRKVWIRTAKAVA